MKVKDARNGTVELPELYVMATAYLEMNGFDAYGNEIDGESDAASEWEGPDYYEPMNYEHELQRMESVRIDDRPFASEQHHSKRASDGKLYMHAAVKYGEDPHSMGPDGLPLGFHTITNGDECRIVNPGLTSKRASASRANAKAGGRPSKCGKCGDCRNCKRAAARAERIEQTPPVDLSHRDRALAANNARFRASRKW